MRYFIAKHQNDAIFYLAFWGATALFHQVWLLEARAFFDKRQVNLPTINVVLFGFLILFLVKELRAKSYISIPIVLFALPFFILCRFEADVFLRDLEGIISSYFESFLLSFLVLAWIPPLLGMALAALFVRFLK